MKILKVAIVGPESTGKSTLSSQLARHYHTAWVPEYAREYIDQLHRPYKEQDLLKIAQGQLAYEDQMEKKAERLLICDTNLIVIKIWSEFKYGRCDPWILDQVKHRHYDLHLLMDVDLPWQKDPQREHPHLRQQLFDIYYRELKTINVSFKVINGNYEERFNKAVDEIDFLFKQIYS